MIDYRPIAKTIIEHSCKLSAGDNFYVSVRGESQKGLAKALLELAEEKRIRTTYSFSTIEERHNFWENATEEEVQKLIEKEGAIMAASDGVALLSDNYSTPLSKQAKDKSNRYFVEVHQKIRLNKKWLLTIVPSMEDCNGDEKLFNEMIQVYTSSCSIDYDKLDKAFNNLKVLMEKTDKVRIVAKDTDLSFSIKGLPAIKCAGEFNLPDGEIFTAPVKNSVNGHITYNLPSKHNGITHIGIRLDFENGKIISQTSDHPVQLAEEFDVDEGARYVGEFAIGVNPLINKCYNNILYDEKIAGSIHFTPGSCYDECDNGNKSVLHWDLVQSHTPEYGGGEIWFDDVLIRKDGRFVLEELQPLNPENLR